MPLAQPTRRRLGDEIGLQRTGGTEGAPRALVSFPRSDNPYGTPVWSWPSATSQSFRKSVQNVAVTSFTPRRVRAFDGSGESLSNGNVHGAPKPLGIESKPID